MTFHTDSVAQFAKTVRETLSLTFPEATWFNYALMWEGQAICVLRETLIVGTPSGILSAAFPPNPNIRVKRKHLDVEEVYADVVVEIKNRIEALRNLKRSRETSASLLLFLCKEDLDDTFPEYAEAIQTSPEGVTITFKDLDFLKAHKILMALRAAGIQMADG